MNKKLAGMFDQIGNLMEIQGGDRFRINSYRRVARTLKDLTGDIEQMSREGRLNDIPGVGKGTAERITQFIETGKITVHQELLAEMPAARPLPFLVPTLLRWDFGTTAPAVRHASIIPNGLERNPNRRPGQR